MGRARATVAQAGYPPSPALPRHRSSGGTEAPRDRETASTWQVKAVQGGRSRSPERTALVHPARTCALALLSLFVGKGLALKAKAHGSPCSSTRRGDSSCCELRSSLRGSVVAPVPYRVGLALRPGTTKNSARRRLCSCCYCSRQRLKQPSQPSGRVVQFSRKKNENSSDFQDEFATA